MIWIKGFAKSQVSTVVSCSFDDTGTLNVFVDWKSRERFSSKQHHIPKY